MHVKAAAPDPAAAVAVADLNLVVSKRSASNQVVLTAAGPEAIPAADLSINNIKDLRDRGRADLEWEWAIGPVRWADPAAEAAAFKVRTKAAAPEISITIVPDPRADPARTGRIPADRWADPAQVPIKINPEISEILPALQGVPEPVRLGQISRAYATILRVRWAAQERIGKNPRIRRLPNLLLNLQRLQKAPRH